MTLIIKQVHNIKSPNIILIKLSIFATGFENEHFFYASRLIHNCVIINLVLIHLQNNNQPVFTSSLSFDSE